MILALISMDDRMAAFGRSFPELFFFGVLGGEIFIDQQNREYLKRPRDAVHPLVRRVLQIHVTEEARHVCFAEHASSSASSINSRLLIA